MSSVPTLQQILSQREQYSQLSEQPSFTLTDILEQPVDEEVIEDNSIGEEDMEGFFEDQEDEGDQEMMQESKVYQFPALQQQHTSRQQQMTETKPNQQITIPTQQLPIKQMTQSKMRSSKSITLGSKLMEDSQISLTQPHQRLAKMPLLPIEEIDNMSFVMLKNVTNLFEDPNNTSIGIPTSIAASGKFLAVGTSMGNIAIFQIGVKGNKILGTPEQRKFGYVCSLSISRDNKYLIAGHESGLVTLWDLYYFSLLKQEINSRSKILQVLFCSETSENFISNDTEGNTYIYTIEKYIWTNMKSQKLLDKSPSPFYDIRYHQLQSNNSLLVMCTLDYVLLISVKPKVNVIGKIVRPDGVSLNYLPNVQVGRCVIEGVGSRGDVRPMYDVLLVSWGKSLHIYRFLPGVNSFGTIEQLLVYEHPSVIYNIQYLSENIFITLDKHQIFRTIRIDIALISPLQTLEEIENRKPQQELNLSQNITANNTSSSTSKQPNISCTIIHSKQMHEQVIYQRLLKSKQQKYIKSFRNTLVNCTFNSDHKEIFFITKNSVYRARLHKWTTFLSSMVNEQKNLEMAMKVALQLKNERLNIFAQKVELLGKKGEKSMGMFCEVGRIFLEQGLKDVKQSNIERARNRQRAQMQVKEIADELRRLYEMVIEYFIELRCQKYLFETIYGKIIKKLPSFEYWQLFIESLKPFIQVQKLRRIPSIQVFKQILEYYSEKKSNCSQSDNMKLIDKMITNLDADSLHYENAVSLLADNKLYKGLAYICSANRDFISPCNKLLTRMIEASQNRLENAEKEYFQILELYLTKLINGSYINDKKVPQRVYETHVLRDVSLWLSFEDTLAYFLRDSQKKTTQDNLQKPPPSRVKILLQWIYKLLQQSAKLREKGNFHELIKHLLQALQNIQNKQLMKKSPESLTKRNNISYIRYQLTLFMVKFGKDVDLNQSQLSFYLKYQYLNIVKKGNINNIQNEQQNLLVEELYFMKKYFELLHLAKIQDHQESKEKKTAYQSLCQLKSDYSKYLYNLLVSSFKVKNQQQNTEIENRNLNQVNQAQAQDQTKYKSQTKIKSNLANSKISEPQSEQGETQSEQLQENSARGSFSSTKSAQIIKKNQTPQKNQTIESLFAPNSKGTFQFPAQSSLIKRRKEMAKRLRELNLQPLSLGSLAEQFLKKNSSKDQINHNEQNYILVDFVLNNFSFEQIDPHVESLIKLNSELVIVYILEHYELDVVNKKIEMIQDEEAKYLVVRRILKMIRNLKRDQKQQKNQQYPFSIINDKTNQPLNTDKLFRVWGNEHRSFAKKKQSINQENKSILQKIVDSNLSESILIFYLSFLARYKREKRVYLELKLNMADYSSFLDKVLQIMRQFELNSCIALIYEHMGDLNHAFEYYQLVYNQRMELNVKKLVLVQHCHGRFLREIFNQMLEVSQKINANQQWMRLLQSVLQPLIDQNKFSRRKKEQVIDLIQKVYAANPNHAFIQQFGQVIQTTLLQVSSHIPTQQISTVFNNYSQLMNKTFMLNCLKSTMHTYSKSIFIYETSNTMVINDQANEFEKIYHENKLKGLNCIPICEHCSELIEVKDKVLIYKCAHVYHRRCMVVGQDKCIKCVLVEVGEGEGEERSMHQLAQLKSKKKQSSMKQGGSSQKIIVQGSETGQSSKNQDQQEKQTQKINTIYRCLAFDQFLERDDVKFDEFRRDYDLYLAKYE